MSLPLPEIPGVIHRQIEARGVDFHVAEAGDGQPVVLLHGWPQHFYCYRDLLADPPAGLKMIAIDLPGYGWSGPAPHKWQKEEVVSDLIALFDVLGLDKFVLVGHDWGGWLGYLISLRVPERVLGYLALNISHVYNGPKQAAALLPLLAYQPLAASVGAQLMRRTNIITRLLRFATAGPNQLSVEDAKVFGDTFRQLNGAEAGRDTYRSFLLHDLPSGIRNPENRRLTVKTRVLFGENDPAVKPVLTAKPKQADDFEVTYVKDCGHFIVDERPELVRQGLLDLVAELS